RASWGGGARRPQRSRRGGPAAARGGHQSGPRRARGPGRRVAARADVGGAAGSAGMSAALDRLTIGHYMLRRWSLEDDVRHLERLGFPPISLASTNLVADGAARARRLLR